MCMLLAQVFATARTCQGALFMCAARRRTPPPCPLCKDAHHSLLYNVTEEQHFCAPPLYHTHLALRLNGKPQGFLSLLGVKIRDPPAGRVPLGLQRTLSAMYSTLSPPADAESLPRVSLHPVRLASWPPVLRTTIWDSMPGPGTGITLSTMMLAGDSLDWSQLRPDCGVVGVGGGRRKQEEAAARRSSSTSAGKGQSDSSIRTLGHRKT